MKTLLLICAIFTLMTRCECADASASEEFPHITDLLPAPAQRPGAAGPGPGAPLLLDLDALDERQLLRTAQQLKQELQHLALNSSAAPQRRFRGYLTAELRQVVRSTWKRKKPWAWSVAKGIHTHLYSTKVADLMLQFIYMARHKLMELDSQTIVKPKPENYRQVFLYKHLVRLSDKIWDVHQIIRNHSRIVHGPRVHHGWASGVMRNTMRLHQRAVKLYVDFTYYWWVFVRTQQRFMERTHVVITRPPSTAFTPSTRGPLPPGDLYDTVYPTTFREYPMGGWFG